MQRIVRFVWKRLAAVFLGFDLLPSMSRQEGCRYFELIVFTNVIRSIPVLQVEEDVKSPLDVFNLMSAIEEAGYSVEWDSGRHLISFKIEGMFCEQCVSTITKAIQNCECVEAVRVSLAKTTAAVVASPSTDPGQIIDAIEATGYDATLMPEKREVSMKILNFVRALLLSAHP